QRVLPRRPAFSFRAPRLPLRRVPADASRQSGGIRAFVLLQRPVPAFRETNRARAFLRNPFARQPSVRRRIARNTYTATDSPSAARGRDRAGRLPARNP